MQQSRFLFFAAVFGFIGVAMGAFGAHGLKQVLTEHALEVYKTAVSYQMYHALALAMLVALPAHKLLHWVGWLFTVGILLFSGSLYILAIFNIPWLGMITPFGGLAFLSGWAVLAYSSLKKSGDSHG